MSSLTCTDIEIAVSEFFGIRENLIVPNVSWGLHLHECDLVVMRPSRYLYEIEIKISKDDIKADLTKRHKHKSDKIKRLYFAIPEELRDCADLIPEQAGIMILYIRDVRGTNHIYCNIIREAKDNPNCRKLTDQEVLALARLGVIRIFPLKKKIRDQRNIIKDLKKCILNNPPKTDSNLP